MKKICLIIVLALIKLSTYGQSNDLPQRDPFILKIAVSDTNFYQADIKASAYILPNNTIQIYPGEKIFIEIELVDKEIKSMKSVKAIVHPEKTLVIALTQSTEGKTPKNMILGVDNPFNYKLDYKCNHFFNETK